MKKELKLHIVFLIAFFLVISLYKSLRAPVFSEGWFTLDHVVFWLGGIGGILLLYIDHFIYAFILNPSQELSQKAAHLTNSKKYGEALNTLLAGHSQQDRLIFHSALFQIIFLVFAFFVVTSTASLLGRGLVFGVLIHLLVDMSQDLVKSSSIDGWFQTVPFVIEQKHQTWYVASQTALLIGLALFF